MCTTPLPVQQLRTPATHQESQELEELKLQISEVRAFRTLLKGYRKCAVTAGQKISLAHAIRIQTRDIERLKSRLKYARASLKRTKEVPQAQA